MLCQGYRILHGEVIYECVMKVKWWLAAGNGETLRKFCSMSISSITNRIWNHPGLNLDIRGKNLSLATWAMLSGTYRLSKLKRFAHELNNNYPNIRTHTLPNVKQECRFFVFNHAKLSRAIPVEGSHSVTSISQFTSCFKLRIQSSVNVTSGFKFWQNNSSLDTKTK